MKICSKCGNKNENYASTCVVCGSSFYEDNVGGYGNPYANYSNSVYPADNRNNNPYGGDNYGNNPYGTGNPYGNPYGNNYQGYNNNNSKDSKNLIIGLLSGISIMAVIALCFFVFGGGNSDSEDPMFTVPSKFKIEVDGFLKEEEETTTTTTTTTTAKKNNNKKDKHDPAPKPHHPPVRTTRAPQTTKASSGDRIFNWNIYDFFNWSKTEEKATTKATTTTEEPPTYMDPLDDTTTTTTTEPYDPEIVIEDPIIPEEPEEPEEPENERTYAEAFVEFIDNYRDSNGANAHYEVADVNGDSQPELIAENWDGEAAVFTYNSFLDQVVLSVKESMGKGTEMEMYYNPSECYVFLPSANTGGESYKKVTTNDVVPMVIENLERENGKNTDDGASRYYIDGNEVSVEEYESEKIDIISSCYCVDLTADEAIAKLGY